METPKPKPCIDCHELPDVKRTRQGQLNVWNATCRKCEISTRGKLEKAQAVTAWNKLETYRAKVAKEFDDKLTNGFDSIEIDEKVIEIDVDNEFDDIDSEVAVIDDKIELDETQVAAVDFAVSQRFAIVTGGAGTGKTTIIKEIASRIQSENKKTSVALCAFTGKAAARLKEATRRHASTIHQLLGFNGERFSAPALTGKTIIVDESSMVSADIMAEIVNRKPDRLILVGDEAQLPPVGKGQPFHDLIKLRPDCVANLTKCWRNNEAVFKAAMMIRGGEMPSENDVSKNERWFIYRTGPADATHLAILEMVKRGDLDFEQDIILCPKNGDKGIACTVKALNDDIVQIVNPRENDEKFLPGDRVINTKNVSEKDVWNGTTGTVHAVDSDGQVWVRLDIPIVDQEKTKEFGGGKRVYKDKVLFTRDMVKSLQLAYALTVHKSQGSQYRRVLFVALERDSRMLLSRSLIYTAITRTKNECVVAGQIQAFWKGIQMVAEKRTIIQELHR